MLLKDFSKMHTFLTVARERSFSKASVRIGISQPAVTQQIKAIEEYLQCQLIERRKNGITLTKEGEALLRVVGKLEEAIEEGERELLRIIDRKTPMVIATCPVVGNYLLPCCLSDLRLAMEGEVAVEISRNQEAADALRSRRADVAIFSPSSFHEELHYKEWIEDEILVVSNQPIEAEIDPAQMERFEWIVRDEQSQTRRVAMGALKNAGVNCEHLIGGGTIFNDATAIKQAILKGPKNPQRPIASLISRFAVSDDLQRGTLYASAIKGCAIGRKFYIACLKERRSEAPIGRVMRFLNDKKALAATF